MSRRRISLAFAAGWLASVAAAQVAPPGAADRAAPAPPMSGPGSTAQAASSAEADGAAPLPPPELKPAPALVPPPLVNPPTPAATPPQGARANAPRPPAAAPSAAAASPPFQGGVIFLRADRIDGAVEKYVEASGKVELRTRTETVLADWLRYDFLTDEVWGKGDVMIRRGIDWVTGPEVKFNRTSETGVFTSPHFYIGENASRGSAAEIRFTGPNRYEATDARYTTCVAPREDWYLRMDELEVDRGRMIGTGHDTTVYLLGAPIVYSPWLEFPLSGERKSGFLSPVLGQSQLRGFEYAQPYYFNLAPNYDATIGPRLMTNRGLQITAQGRYLFDTFQGEATAEYLSNDRVTGETRWGVAWKHTQNLAFLPGLVGYWNINKVSDDTYFADLSDRVGLTSQTTLPREAGLAYSNAPWTVIARAQTFQTLVDPGLPPTPPPYNRVPQLLVALHEADWNGLTFAGTAEYADFRNPTLVTGTRAYVYPTVAWTRQGSAWYFTATTGVHARTYDLNDNAPDRNHLNYVIPVTSVDAGLVFERDWSAFGQNFLQTLEPRAYYVYVPYRDQSAAPVFDSAIDDYNFAQLFSANRYLGNDRIGDANQLTLALTSRFLDPSTGAERLRVTVGERLYFQNQRVTLTEAPQTSTTSDFLIGAEGRLSDAWALSALWEYSFNPAQTERLDLGLRYTPAPGIAFNASYRYARLEIDQTGLLTELNQINLSTQWPIGNNWTLLGELNYSFVDRRALEVVAGVEYNGGCWALRVVGQRLITATETTANSVYLQIELNGLARFGTNPLELLRRSVPGYQRTNDPTLSPRDREDLFQEF